MIDFHTHILPEMDDGSDGIETSLGLLKMLENDDVKLVCLTSHFYPSSESIDEFIARRKKAVKKLNYRGNLKLKLGAEVRYYHGISVSEDIDKLLLQGTKILLVELPFVGSITNSMIEEIIQLRLKGYDVVLAHIERYNLSHDTLDHLYNFGIKFQMNTSAITGFFSGMKAIKLIKEGYIYYLGSDCHNMVTRKPNFGEAIEKLRKILKVQDVSIFIKGLYNIK